MSLGHGAKIVRNGLVLHLDAASVRSYPGSGTTWYDLSGNNRNGSINNSPIINENSFTFDGVNDNINFPNLVDLSHTDVITISFWCKLNSFTEPDGGIHGMLLEATDNFNGNTDGFYIGVGDDSTSSFNNEFPISLNIKGDVGYNIHGYDKTSVNDLKWHYWICIFNKGVGGLDGTNPVESEFYIDGVSKPVTTYVSTSLRQNNKNNFGETTFYIGGRAGNSYNLDFSLGSFSIYDRILSLDEIKQNYFAYRGRYGLGSIPSVVAPSEGTPSEGTDAYWDNVTLLLPLDGTNGQTTQTDLSNSNNTVTFNGGAQISTAQSKFGGSSVVFDTNGDWVQVSYDESLNLATGDFTIETWCYFLENPINEQAIFTQQFFSGGAIGIAIFFYNGELVWGHYGGPWTRYTGSGWYPNLNQWYHIVVQRRGDTSQIIVDGVQQGSDITLSTNLTLPFATSNFYIGRRWDTNGDPWLAHYQDDFRITKGVARYTPTVLEDNDASNLLDIQYRENFDGWVAPNSAGLPTIEKDAELSPENTLTADTLTDNGSRFPGIRRTIVASAGDYTFSLFIKKTTGATSFPGLQIGTSPYYACIVNTNDGTTTGATGGSYATPVAHGTQDYNSEYWRAYLTVSATGNFTVEFYPALATSSDGSSVNSAAVGSATIWGAKAELASTMSDYIAVPTSNEAPTSAHPTQ